MYTPRHFSESDPATLHSFMRRFSFGLLIAGGNEGSGPQAAHLPLSWRPQSRDGAAAEHGVLAAHVARANPIWRTFKASEGGDGHEALCVFQGPHAYVSPRWYVTEPQVPTWNYTAVHAYG